MEAVFLKIFNMSITAGWIALAVIITRLFLKKAPKWVNVLLWSLVGIRLICPISFESVFSLIPSAETVPLDIMYTDTPTVHTGIGQFNSVINPVISESLAPNIGDSVNPMQVITFLASVIWLIGIGCMLMYFLLSYLRIMIKVREAVAHETNVFICDRVASPFILGVIRPKIYLPSNMDKSDYDYVLAHEKAHLKRFDHLWKPLGFLLLTVYWFNPLLWIAYILLCRDIEFACDEKVIKEMGVESKKPYSEALINCSAPGSAITACPLAFGETGIKGRIKSVLNYKKPALWIIIASVILGAGLAVCFLTNPKTDIDERLIPFIDCKIASFHQTEDTAGRYSCLDWEVIGKEKKGDITNIYLWVLYCEFDYENELIIKKLTHTPALITVEKEKGEYRIIEYWQPSESESVKEKFPSHLWDKALSPNDYYDTQYEKLKNLAEEHYKENPKTTRPPYSFEITDFTDTLFSINSISDAYEKMLEAGAYSSNLVADSRFYLPTVKIISTAELERFKEIMFGDEDFSISSKYTDSFFEENTLFLIYTYAPTLSERYFVDYVEKHGEKLDIAVAEIFSDAGDMQVAHWLIALEIPNSCNVKDVEEVDARICSQIFPNKSTVTADSKIVKKYIYPSYQSAFMSPFVTLYDNGKFIFSPGVYSSYIAYGDYEEKDGCLKLFSEEDGYVYYFDEVENGIAYSTEDSTAPDWVHNSIKDGAVFFLYGTLITE